MGYDTLAKRLWNLVDTSNGINDCWPYTGYIMPNGYGTISVKRGIILTAHRAAYIVTRGYIPAKDIDVCHSCDELYPINSIEYRCCCNPWHLYSDSRQNNMKHCAEINRATRNGSLLTIEEVKQARIDFEQDNTWGRVTTLADKYGVSVPTMSELLSHSRWKYLP